MKVEVKINEDLKETLVQIHTRQIDDEVNKIISKLSSNYTVLTGICDEKTYIINEKDIYVIYGENKKVFARTEDKIFRLKHRLYELEKNFENTSLIRISNSAIINIDYVESLEAMFNGTIVINFKDGTKEYVSRRYISKIKKFLNL